MSTGEEDPSAVKCLIGFYEKPTQGASDPPYKKK